VAQKLITKRLEKRISSVDSTANRLELAARALLESEEKYRTIVEDIEDGYYEVDLGGNFVFFNNAMARMTGYSPQELTGMNNRDIMDAYNAGRVFEVFNKVYVTSLAARAFDWELIKKDGSRCTVEVSISPKRSLQGQTDGFMGIARDITQRKLMEQALRESEEKYRMIIENIEDGYYEVDLAGNFTFFNDAMCRMVGYSRKELMRMNNRQIMDKFNAKQVFTVFHTVYKTGLPTKAMDWELIGKDGQRRIIEVSVSSRKNLSGEPVGFMGIARDITERKLSEKTLRSREEELRVKSLNLEEVNTALKVLLRKREEDRRELEDTIMNNLQDTVKPYLVKAKKRTKNKRLAEILAVLESNLETITSPFSHKLSSKFINLTSTEIEVANLVKQGMSTKEIADLLSVSSKTVEVHRLNIRKKIGLNNKRANLRAHLLSIR
jgi:PAS domain S-box-containing protein